MMCGIERVGFRVLREGVATKTVSGPGMRASAGWAWLWICRCA